MRAPAPILLVAGLACSEPGGPIEAEAPPPVEVRVMLDGKPKAGGGNLRVQTEYDASGEVDVPSPESPGLTFTANGVPTLENLGGRAVVTERYVFSGPAGHYEIQPLTVTWRPPGEGEPITASSTSLFVDLEVEPVQAGELADIEEAPALWRVPWVPVLTVGALFVAGLAIAFWPRRAPREEVRAPVAPDVLALRAWEAVRADPALTDEGKARELSVIFRRYTEAVLQFEATAWTTSEILRHLEGMAQLPEGNVPRARRMLRATDRIKFAEERPTHELIEELDADLRAFVQATRPAAWGDT